LPGRRGVGTVIGAALLALLLLAALGFIYYLVSAMTEFYQELSGILGEKTGAPLLASGISGWWRQAGSTLQVHLENGNPAAVLVTSVTVLWSDGTVTVYDRNNATAPAFTATVAAPGGAATAAGGLPLALGVSYTADIYIDTGGRTTDRVYVTISASPVVAVIPLRNYYELYPNATAINATNLTLPYDIKLLPEPLNGETVAVRAYAATLSQPRPIQPVSITVIEGTLIAGSASDLAASDNSYVVVEPVLRARCGNYADWLYYMPIIVTNPNPYNYQDIQVRIELNATNFDFTHANSDGSDLRVVLNDASCTQLNYWVQEWDAANQRAIIWVKLPEITANGEVGILLLYGNPSAIQQDPNYEGITRVMTSLPAGDGAGYIIQYEEWIMPLNLFEETGEAQGWHGDDEAWDYALPFSFPYYSSTYTTVYVGSNGIIGMTGPITQYRGDVDTFITLNAIAPFWADTRTDLNDFDIFINNSYSDKYGEGVYIRWYTGFYSGRNRYSGEQNFASVLYSNGLIRFDYGTIYGSATTDSTQVVGVSFGDGTHYTITSYDYSNLSDYPSDYPSLMLWPRKKPVEELSYSIGSERRNTIYIVETTVSFNVNTNGYTTLADIYIEADEPNGIVYNYTFTVSADGTILYTDSNSLATALRANYTIWTEIESSSLEATLKIESTNSFQLYLDTVLPRIAVLTITANYVATTSNTTHYLYLFDTTTNTTSSYDLTSTGLPATGYTALAMDPLLGRQSSLLWVARGTILAAFNVTEKAWASTISITLPEPLASGAILHSNGTHIFYSPGGESTILYVIDIETGSTTATVTLPEKVTTWSSIASADDMIYILPGSTSTLIELSTSTLGITTRNSAITRTTGACLDKDTGLIWIIPRGGSLLYYDTTTSKWSASTTPLPYYPLEPGDRLACIGDKLYHVRNDGTSILLIIETG